MARVARVGLLDVNVLIALAWPNHVHHVVARRWFDRHHAAGWATSPVTELGFVRVSSNRAAIATATTPALAGQLLEAMTAISSHRFWADDVRGFGGAATRHREVTDDHLLALAERNDGAVVTFDRGVRRLLGDRAAELLELIDDAGTPA